MAAAFTPSQFVYSTPSKVDEAEAMASSTVLIDFNEALASPPSSEGSPHPREACPVCPFRIARSRESMEQHREANYNSCPSCWCYVCNCSVADCLSWSAHCNASHHSTYWRELRDTKEDPVTNVLTGPQKDLYMKHLFCIIYPSAQPSGAEAGPGDTAAEQDETTDDESQFIKTEPLTSHHHAGMVYLRTLLLTADNDQFIVAVALVLRTIKKFPEYRKYWLLPVVVRAVLHDMSSPVTAQVIKQHLTAQGHTEVCRMLNLVEGAVAEPAKLFTVNKMFFYKIQPDIALAIADKVYDQLDKACWQDYTMQRNLPEIHATMLVIMIRHITKQSVSTFTPRDIYWLHELCKVPVSVFRACAEPFSAVLPPHRLLRFIGLLFDSILPHMSTVTAGVLDDVIRILLKAVFRSPVADSTALVNQAIAALADCQHHAMIGSLVHWINMQLDIGAFSEQSMALMMLWLFVVRLSKHTFPAAVNIVHSIDINAAMAICSLFITTAGGQWPNVIKTTLMDAAHDCCGRIILRADYNSAEHSIVDEALNEYLRMPVFVQAVDDVMKTYHVYARVYDDHELVKHAPNYQALACRPPDLILRHLTFRAVQNDLMGPTLGLPNRFDVLGRFISGNELAMALERFLNHFNTLLEEADVLLVMDENEDTIKIIWKSLLIALYEAILGVHALPEAVLKVCLGMKKARLDWIMDTLSVPAVMMSRGIQLFCILQTIRIVSDLHGYKSMKHLFFEAVSKAKKEVWRLLDLLDVPGIKEAFSYAYMLCYEQNRNGVEDVVGDIWKVFIGYAKTFHAEIKPTDRVTLGMQYEDWLLVEQNYSLYNTSGGSIEVWGELPPSLLVWRDAEGNYAKLMQIFESCESPWFGAKYLLNKPIRSGSRDSILFEVLNRLSERFVLQEVCWQTPLLCARLSVLIASTSENSAMVTKKDHLLVDIANKMRSYCASAKVEDLGLIMKLFSSATFLGNYKNLSEAHLERMSNPKSFPADKYTAANRLLLFCPEVHCDGLVAELMPFLAETCKQEDQHKTMLLCNLDQNILHPKHMERYAELWFYVHHDQASFERLMALHGQDSPIKQRVLTWVQCVMAQAKGSVQGFLTMLQVLLDEQSFNAHLLNWQPSPAAALSTYSDVNSLLPMLVQRDGALCVLARCLWADEDLLSHGVMSLEDTIQIEWLEPTADGPEEAEFAKIYLKMRLDGEHSLEYLQQLRQRSSSLYDAHRAHLLGINVRGKPLIRIFQLLMSLGEFSGMVDCLRGVIFDGGLVRTDMTACQEAMATLMEVLTPNMLAGSQAVDEESSLTPHQLQCVMSMSNPQGFLRILAKLILDVQGYLYAGGQGYVALQQGYSQMFQQLAEKVSACCEGNPFIAAYLQCCIDWFAGFDNALELFKALPHSVQEALRDGQVIMQLIISAMPNANCSTMLEVMHQILLAHAKNLLSFAISADIFSLQDVRQLLRRIFGSPTYTLPSALPEDLSKVQRHLVFQGGDTVVSKLYVMLQECGQQAALALDESVLMALAGSDPDRGSPAFSMDVILEAKPTDLPQLLQLSGAKVLDASWRMVVKAIFSVNPTVFHYLEVFTELEYEFNLANLLLCYAEAKNRTCFLLWRAVARLLVVHHVTSFQGNGDPMRVIQVLAANLYALQEQQVHLFTEEELDKILKYLSVRWMLGMLVHGSPPPYADIINLPKLLTFFTKGQLDVLCARLQDQAVLGTIWKALVEEATNAPGPNRAIPFILSALLELSSLLITAKVDTKNKKHLLDFLTTVKGFLAPHREEFAEDIEQTIKKALVNLKPKHKIAAHFQMLLQVE